jgi:hypothetical protein
MHLKTSPGMFFNPLFASGTKESLSIISSCFFNLFQVRAESKLEVKTRLSSR